MNIIQSAINWFCRPPQSAPTATAVSARDKYDRYSADDKAYVAAARKRGTSWERIAKKVGAPNRLVIQSAAYSWRAKGEVDFPVRPRRHEAAAE